MLDTLPLLTDEPVPAADEAGFGALTTARGALPLEALSVRTRLEGLFAAVEVRQRFVNAHDEPLEATYIFPLPDRAAVSRFRLEVAGRVIEGDLQERGQARQTYDQAITAGHRAAIAEEERPGVFTLRVGNLPPGERADVTLDLVGPLPFRDGEVTFRFPLVVAPRYVPGTPLPRPPVGAGGALDTDAAPDASRISPPVLLPGFPSPVRLSLVCDVPASALPMHSFRSSLHTVAETESEQGRSFRLVPGERLDRDFVLRYRLGDGRLQTALSVQPDAEGEEGTFLLTLVPPAVQPDARPAPRDVVFVLDRSGSMGGWKMVAARRAVQRMVETLTADDRFAVYAFDDELETPPGFDGVALVPATDRRRFVAVEFLGRIDARGGTEMAAPLEQAAAELTRHPTPGGQRILVLITDGQVANEDQILRKLGPMARGVRIFTLGIDQAVNAAFLRRLADLGGGGSEVVESQERLDEVMDQMHRHIGTPVLTGLEVRPAGLDVIAASMVPGRLPDLFAGAPVTVLGRYRGRAAALAVRARDAHGEGWAAEVTARVTPEAPLARVWARGRVRELEDQYAIGGHDRAKLEGEIVGLSLRFGVLSRFTAFVAVDKTEVVNPGGQPKLVTQPVEAPADWEHADMYAGILRLSAGSVTMSGALPCMAPPAPPCPAPPMPACAAPAWLAPPAPTRGAASSSAPAEFFMEASATTDYDLQAEAPSAGPPRPGLLSLLLSFFGLAKKQQPPTPAVDRTVYRRRVESLVSRLGGDDPAVQLPALRTVFVELEKLFRDLVDAGDRDESVQRLGKLLVSLQHLLAQQQPAVEAIADHHRRVVAALQAWLNLLPATPPAPQAFWK